ncbi:lumenal Hsp70 protein [Tulasnella sp. 418]|nr:lumenal Hsp70 protein [Tulasnella sp. 418]
MIYQEIGSYDILAEYTSENKNKVMRTPIFTPKSKLKTPKKYDFKRKNDFNIKLVYKNPGSIDFPQEIMDVKVTGVSEKYANLTAEGAVESDIHVKVSFALNESGMLQVEEPYIFADVKRKTFIEKVKSVLGGESSSSASSTSTEGSESATSAAPETTETTTTETVTLPLGLETTQLSYARLEADDKNKAMGRLVAIEAAEKAKARREEAYNHLEGYLYRLRDLLEGDSKSPFMDFSQPAERELLTQKLAEGFEWLAENDKADATELWKKRDELEAVEHPVIARYKEAETGPKALSNLQKALFAGRTFLKEARANHTAENEAGTPNKYTAAELDSVEALLTEAESWLSPLIEQQKKLTKREDPVLKTADMDARGKVVQSTVTKLMKRKPPKVPKPKPVESTTSEQPRSEETQSSQEKPRDEL